MAIDHKRLDAENDLAESAYWRFDARRAGYGRWDGIPMSERDAFKAEVRNVIRTTRVMVASEISANIKERTDGE